MQQNEITELIEKVPFWFHSIELGHGLVTNGQKSLETLGNELRQMSLPSLTGKTVLDIGAWDGFFSFAAETLGASRVMALDHYVWSMNLSKQQEYWRNCKQQNIVPSQYHLVPGHWSPGTLPGKLGFDTAHRIRNSKVEQYVGDFMKMDPIEIGMYDVVFFLGVLYHLEDPLRGLRRLSMYTRELAIIETAAVYVDKHENDSLLEFYGSNELCGDVSNWFAPNLRALEKMCLAAGFKKVVPVSAYPPPIGDQQNPVSMRQYRLTLHAYK